MPRTIYCWRCQMDLPMLTEDEWRLVSPHLSDAAEQINHYRQQHSCSLAEAKAKGFGQLALQLFEKITGFKETNPTALFHHRLSLYGPPCTNCGKPLRTPKARYCPLCGTDRISNEDDTHGSD